MATQLVTGMIIGVRNAASLNLNGLTQLVTGMIVGVRNAASLNLNGHSVGHWDDSRCSECCIAKLEWPLSWSLG